MQPKQFFIVVFNTVSTAVIKRERLFLAKPRLNDNATHILVYTILMHASYEYVLKYNAYSYILMYNYYTLKLLIHFYVQ